MGTGADVETYPAVGASLKRLRRDVTALADGLGVGERAATIAQAASEAAANAIVHGHGGGDEAAQIEVELARNGNGWVLTVGDRGGGGSAGAQQRGAPRGAGAHRPARRRARAARARGRRHARLDALVDGGLGARVAGLGDLGLVGVLLDDEVAVAATHHVLDLELLVAREDEEAPRVLADGLVVG